MIYAPIILPEFYLFYLDYRARKAGYDIYMPGTRQRPTYQSTWYDNILRVRYYDTSAHLPPCLLYTSDAADE